VVTRLNSLSSEKSLILLLWNLVGIWSRLFRLFRRHLSQLH
jgi:hypothetical protein